WIRIFAPAVPSMSALRCRTRTQSVTCAQLPRSKTARKGLRSRKDDAFETKAGARLGGADEIVGAFFRLSVHSRDHPVAGGCRHGSGAVLALLQRPAGLFAASELRAAGDDAG